MADQVALMLHEYRRRMFTVLGVAGVLTASTLPVTNQRALFNALDPTLDADALAYGVIMTTGFGGKGGGNPRHGSGRRTPGPPSNATPPPVAYGVRVPNDPGIFGPPDQPSLVTQTGLPPVPQSFLPAAPPPLGGPTGSFPPGTSTGSRPAPDPTSPVPEPATWLLMICGFLGMGSLLRRARARRSDHRSRTSGMLSECSGDRPLS